MARSIAAVEFGLKHPGHYKVLFEGRVVLRLNDPRIADFGRPLLVRSIELIRDIPPASAKARVSEDPQRLALLLWSGLHGVISLRINKPTLDWPPATELAEQVTRAKRNDPAPPRAAGWGLSVCWLPPSIGLC